MESLMNSLGIPPQWTTPIQAVLLIVLGLPVLIWLSRRVQHRIGELITSQHGLIAGKSLLYAGVAGLGVVVLSLFGFPLGNLLGAAGILGIALGFASQTSISNIISGLFIMGERPFVVGDIVTIGDVSGEVLSIDTLSIKVRTFDNKFIRLPNETIIKSQVTNLTRFPIRRFDLDLSVAYKEHLGEVRQVLMASAQGLTICLREPEPLVMILGFGESGINIRFAVWVLRKDWLEARSLLIEEVKRRFDQEGIEIPFPHLSLYRGAASQPLQVELLGSD